MIIPNTGQRYAIDEGVKFLRHSSDQVFQLGGAAGTGKSVVLHSIVEEAGLKPSRVLALAYTGQAAIVMRTKGFHTATTIHSGLLRAERALLKERGNVVMNTQLNSPYYYTSFEPKAIDPRNYDVIIIDEGTLVPWSLRQTIESHGIKVLVAGDNNQLPPPCDKQAYLTNPEEIVYLTQLMRQAEESSLIWIAMRVIQGLPIHAGFYPSKYGNVLVIEEAELSDQLILRSDIILANTNKTRDRMNKRVREEILRRNYKLPLVGDRVICRQNNWREELYGISLANGLTGTVHNPVPESEFDGKTFSMDFLPDLLDVPFRSVKCDYKYFTGTLEERNRIKKDRFSVGNKFELAYAITTYLSQGSEFFQGIYIQDFMGDQDFRRRSDYTAVTRFKRNAIIVIPTVKKYW